ILLGGAGSWYLVAHKATPAPVAVQSTPKPTPTPVATPVTKLSPLTGLAVAPELADRPITGVVIENHPDARPQSGLSQAGVVYEALAEGGITRFLAFYGDQQAGALGPVRSVRTYFVDWTLEYDAPLAHAGGNADALDLIGPLGMKNMDGLGIGAPTFYRINDRYSPHNLYTSGSLLDALEDKYGFKTSTFVVSPRKKDEPGTGAHPTIHIDYSYSGYQVDYKYDPATNDYARALANAPHIDKETGKQIHVKNIVVEYMPTSYGFTRINEQTVMMKTVGTGKAIVFRDGNAVEGTWSKASHNARTELLDASGQAIPLDAGNTWYSIVPNDKVVSY
ncbi:MAG: DUF3048 domain-containing protein, partial [Candidatus Saccharibacteria bacterium]